jgi:two-component system, cell cycle sensor histidine kinase and response regulator CckA
MGTTFKIYLPKYEGIITDAMEEKTKPIPKGKGEWVLVVEDNDSVLKLAEIMLTGLGYTVLTAKTRGEAMDLVKRHTQQIQLLIVDVVMPEMNGRELANQLAAQCPAMACLYMSGYTGEAIAHQGILDEGVHFIQKPFSLPSLAAKVREVLDADEAML